MDRGENLFAQNWVEQWKRNVREHGRMYMYGVDEPSLENARIYGVNIWGWVSNNELWNYRMNCLNPSWADSDEEELRRTAGESVPQMIR